MFEILSKNITPKFIFDAFEMFISLLSLYFTCKINKCMLEANHYNERIEIIHKAENREYSEIINDTKRLFGNKIYKILEKLLDKIKNYEVLNGYLSTFVEQLKECDNEKYENLITFESHYLYDTADDEYYDYIKNILNGFMAYDKIDGVWIDYVEVSRKKESLHLQIKSIESLFLEKINSYTRKTII